MQSDTIDPLATFSRRPARPALAALLGAILLAGAATADDPPPPLAEFFGFEPLDILPVGPNAGPMLVVDFDGDNLHDLVVVNNRRSRIELFRQRPGASPADPVAVPTRTNELPDHWRFERSSIPVGHEIGAIAAYDFDGDGLVDLVYAGQPGSIVVLRQREPGTFEVARRIAVRGLASGRDGLAVANLIGDAAPELVAIVNGRIQIWPILPDFRLGEPVVLSAGTGSIAAFLIDDLDGSGDLDLVGVIPEDPAPIRVWRTIRDGERLSLGPQWRFEMPALRRAATLRLPNDPRAKLAVLERAARRLAVFDLEPTGSDGGGESSLEFIGFEDPSARRRSVVVADVDGDGLLDLVATHVDANAIVVYRQQPGRGFAAAESHPAYAELEGLAAADLDGSGRASVLALSEREGVLGRSRWHSGGLSFPTPLPLSPGHVPVSVAAVQLDRGPTVAAVVRDGRAFALDLIGPDGSLEKVPLGELGRAPSTILALDADADGRTDLLLFTPERPMLLLRATAEGWRLLESKDMGQFGLVQAASADNTAVMDFDANGREELLVADRNFVRALRYDEAPADGASPGWQVAGQLNADRADSRLVSLAVLADRVVAADRANNRLVVFGRDEGEPRTGVPGRWRQVESIDLRGFRVRSIEAGRFTGGSAEEILVIADDGFAVVRLAGGGASLVEIASWRPEDPRSLHHDLAWGDLNGDGFTDLVLADAGTQSVDLLTFSADGALLPALSFRIFDTRIFSGGEVREFEPRQMAIADLTGDGLEDLVLLCHDRVLVHPQQAASDTSGQ
jgi:hypothetical protein